jgi:tellurite resistance protein TerC
MDALLAVISADFLGKPAWIWLSFIGIVIALLAFDLGVLHRKTHEIDVAKSLWLSAGYIAMGCLFGVWVWWYLGSEPGMQYFTGFFVEKSLAMDNVFVISLIFTYFAIPRIYQHRVLVWGILGVIVLRGIMIGLGAALINEFDWILFIFGAFLLITGIKMLVIADK